MELQPLLTLGPTDKTAVDHAWSPSSDHVAVAGLGIGLSVWGVPSRDLLTTVSDLGFVDCVTWAPDGQMLAAGTADGAVALLSPRGQMLARIVVHTDEVRALAFSPDGRFVASGGNDGAVSIIDVGAHAVLARFTAHLPQVRSVAWSPDGQQLASGGHDAHVRVWARESWAAQGGLSDHRGFVSKVGYSPDGRRLASGSGDSTLRLWDLAARRYSLVLEDFDQWWLTDFAFAPDGGSIVTLDSNPTVRIFDTASGRCVAQRAAPFTCASVGWSPDGQHVSLGGPGLQVWDVG